ncbi:alpha/beta hydrolase domain-containing protein [Nonomuraea sp. NPDC050643]|uniref:alpha/beta hydrolase domain-containing protein n=1 Tax=Nonomuraea sp. NPDC050643 TaxID=3155660 RepID=UPI003403C553
MRPLLACLSPYEVMWSRSFRHLLDEGYAWVFTQAAQALTGPRDARPLGDLQVRTLIATGQSQSASRLAVYANSVHPLAPVYDVITIVDGGVRIRPDLTSRVFKTAGVSGLLAGPTAPCVSPARSNLPYEYVLNAMFDHAVRWARENRRPPTAPRLEVTDTTTSACRQGGTWIPFDETTLEELYPRHRDHVTKVRQATERNLRDGFITRRDADRTVRDAERSDVGR